MIDHILEQTITTALVIALATTVGVGAAYLITDLLEPLQAALAMGVWP